MRTSLRPDLRDLRADRSVRGLQGHRQALVLRVQAAVDPLRWLRRGRSAARRNSRRAVVLVVHPARQRLAQLPRLRPTRTVPPRAVRSLLGHEAPARTARRRHRHHPGRPGSPLPGAGRDRAARHAERLARQKRRAPDAARARRTRHHPPSTRRAAHRQDGRAPAQHPRRHGNPAHPRRTHDATRTLGRRRHRRARRPR